ncbi:hypothetical protein LOTGIDRAFT_165350 [Lottia gigantea]|uniref:Uncharacterized protein n=1 Tax=Lottia gigantea TaxID=225164 RepID=V3ZW19_LOTGI|nr:hypothetical protein LOTGIDRAFT_165350 [Lottia gigantea]ESO88567.1 hypothetical protein LOTGIDRAFT_165350 [Lottia gigantea]
MEKQIEITTDKNYLQNIKFTCSYQHEKSSLATWRNSSNLPMNLRKIMDVDISKYTEENWESLRHDMQKDVLEGVDIQEIVKAGGRILRILDGIVFQYNLKTPPYRDNILILRDLRYQYKTDGDIVGSNCLKLLGNMRYKAETMELLRQSGSTDEVIVCKVPF